MVFTDKATYILDGEEIEFNYVKKPTLSQKMRIVDNVVNGVVSEVAGYNPILHNYFLATSLVSELTDIKLPESFNEIDEFIEKTGILEIISNLIGNETYYQITGSISDKICYTKIKSANKTSIDDLIESLTSLVQKYDKMFDEVDVNEVSSNIAEIAKFANIKESDIVKNILEYRDKTKETE